MDDDVEAVVTPVTVKIEDDQTVELGASAREALRIEQVQDLREALDAIVEYANGEPLDELIRAQHEDLGERLRAADRASSAIWWLIPADVYTEDNE